MVVLEGTGTAGAVWTCSTWNIDRAPRRGDRPEAIRLPPLSSSRTGPPQKLVRQARKGPPPRDCCMRSSKGGHHGAGHVDRSRRLPTVAYLQKSGQNGSQGPVIHRPQPHRKHTGLWEFRATQNHRPPAPGRRGPARSIIAGPPPEAGTHAAAGSARGRRPVKYETEVVTILMIERVQGGGRPASRPERPTERASSKAGDRTTRGVRALLGPKGEMGSHPVPVTLVRERRQGREGTQNTTHCA